MQYTIKNHETGEVAEIYRDVCTRHPAWVLAQMGVESESELQHALDGLSVDDWYGTDGKSLGHDVCGIIMTR